LRDPGTQELAFSFLESVHNIRGISVELRGHIPLFPQEGQHP
jgi:hypothetical protein